MANSWQEAVVGAGIAASQLNQLLNALTQARDIGQGAGLYQPIADPGAPTAAINTASGNLTGAYSYLVVYRTGGVNNAGTILYYSGNTTAAGAVSNVVNPSAEQVNLSSIPTGPTGVIARDLYRTKAGGSTYYYLDTLQDNVSTDYTDNTADSGLGNTTAPAVNTTGTPWGLPVYPGLPGFGGFAGAIAGMLSGSTSVPIWWDQAHWQTIPLLSAANTWAAAQTFSASATFSAATAFAQTPTFSAGITGSGTTGALGAGSGILGTANTWGVPQTWQNNSGNGGVQGTMSSNGSDAALALTNTGAGGTTYWLDSSGGTSDIGQGYLGVWYPAGTTWLWRLNASKMDFNVVANFLRGMTVPSGRPATFNGSLTTIGGQTTAGTYGALATLAVTENQEITSTSTTTLWSITPPANGIYSVKCYLRVITAATTVTLTLSYADSGGAQTYTPSALNAQSIAVGSHGVVAFDFEAVTGTAIVLSITCGTADQVYVTSALVGVA